MSMQKEAKLTFGGWIRHESAGLMNLGTTGTIALFGLMVGAVLVNMAFGIVPALILAVLGGGVLLGMSIRDLHGDNMWERVTAKQTHRADVASGANLYRSGLFGKKKSLSCELPGVISNTRLHEFRDSHDRPFVLIEYPATNDWVLVLGAEPDGSALVDEEVFDTWVAHWGDWIANLGEETGVLGASVVVETAPDTGHRLRSEVQARMDPYAPEFAVTVMNNAVAVIEDGSPRTRFFVTVTWDGNELAESRKPADVGLEIATRLTGLTEALSFTGAGFTSPLTANELSEYVRTAWDPAIAGLLDETKVHSPEEAVIPWDEAGPVAFEAGWEWIRHDSAISSSWILTKPPRGVVQSSILRKFLEPTTHVERKRAAIVYTPADAGEAEKLVTQIGKATQFNAGSKSRKTVGDRKKVTAADQMDVDLNNGSGIAKFSMILTSTITGSDQLAKAKAASKRSWQGARLRMRPAYGSQAAAYVTSLPLGLIPRRHLTPPVSLGLKEKK